MYPLLHCTPIPYPVSVSPFDCLPLYFWWLSVVALMSLSRFLLVPSSRTQHEHGLRERPVTPFCGARGKMKTYQPSTS